MYEFRIQRSGQGKDTDGTEWDHLGWNEDKKGIWRLGTVDPAYNPRTLGSQGEWLTWGQEFKTSLANMAKPYLSQKYKN